MALEQFWQANLSEDTKVHYSNNRIASQQLAHTEAYIVQKYQSGHNWDEQLQILIKMPVEYSQ